MANTPDPLTRWAGRVALALTVWVCISFAFTPLRASHDEWWHLKTGRQIIHHGLPEHDIFTYTAADIPWHNHEWLSQVAIWGVFVAGREGGMGGLRALILVKTLFIVAAFAGFGFLLARRMREPVWALLAAAVAAALARRTFYPRPPFITYLLLALLFWMLLEWRAGRLRERWLWLLVPVFALWTNLHGGWAAGFIFLAAFWADAALVLAGARLGNADMRPALQRLGLLTALGLACALATLANPYGWRVYEIFINVLGDQYLVRQIGEMMPPNWHFIWALEGTILLLAAAAIRPRRPATWLATLLLLVGLHFYLRHTANHPWVATALIGLALAGALVRARPPGWPALLLLGWFFSQQGIHHVRHLPLMALALLPSIAFSLEHWSVALAERSSAPAAARRRHALAGLIALAALTLWWTFSWREQPTYWQRNLRLARGMETEPGAYPQAAVDFLLSARLPAPLFNGGNYAGYLMWRLAPEPLSHHGHPLPDRPGYRLFTDNRYDIYGGRFIRLEHSVINAIDAEQARMANERYALGERVFQPWDKVLDDWDVQTVFADSDWPVNDALAEAGWLAVWRAPDFTIWVRDTPANQPAIERARALLGR